MGIPDNTIQFRNHITFPSGKKIPEPIFVHNTFVHKPRSTKYVRDKFNSRPDIYLFRGIIEKGFALEWYKELITQLSKRYFVYQSSEDDMRGEHVYCFQLGFASNKIHHFTLIVAIEFVTHEVLTFRKDFYERVIVTNKKIRKLIRSRYENYKIKYMTSILIQSLKEFIN